MSLKSIKKLVEEKKIKTFKEQSEELIEDFEKWKHEPNEKYLVMKKVETLIEAGEYFLDYLNYIKDSQVHVSCKIKIEEIQDSITKLKEAIKQ